MLILRRFFCGIALCLSAISLHATEPLRVMVGDPLSKQMACACVAGYAQRDYSALATALEKKLERPVVCVNATTIETAKKLLDGKTPDLLIGKSSKVIADSKGQAKCLAYLTDLDGKTTLHGCLVVRTSDAANSLADIVKEGYTIIAGPADEKEKSEEMFKVLEVAGWKKPDTVIEASSCIAAVSEMMKREGKYAAIVSDYALPLIPGCGACDEGEIKVIARTAPIPFVGIFHLDLDEANAKKIQNALIKVTQDPSLRKILESRYGFVSPSLAKDLVWKTLFPIISARFLFPPVAREQEKVAVKLNHQSLGGIASDGKIVVVSDKSHDGASDLWRAFDVETLHEEWSVAYPASNEMDYTGAPRATPVFVEGERIILLGAWGDLLCIETQKGKILWQKKIEGPVPQWGFCGTPLVIGSNIIVQDGTGLCAYAIADGKQIWKTPGEAPGYGSLIYGQFGGVEQIVGHEVRDLCGWTLDGKKLWKLTPPEKYDFNVPTPLKVGKYLFVVTENNPARLYDFDKEGKIIPKPIAQYDAASSQTTSPFLVGDTIYGVNEDTGLWVLRVKDNTFEEVRNTIEGTGHCNFFHAGKYRWPTLIFQNGSTLSLPYAPPPYAQLNPKEKEQPPNPQLSLDKPTEVWSQPCSVGDSIFIRTSDALYKLAPAKKN